VTARARVVTAIVWFAASVSAARAAPSPADKQARRAFQSAEAHFRAGRFADALADYQAGYEQSPRPGFLINIAQCHRRLGDLHKARATYQKFVMVAPDSPHVPEVKTLIGELDKLIASLETEKRAREPDAPAPAPERETSVAETEPEAPAPASPAPLPAAPAPRPSADRDTLLVDSASGAAPPTAAPPPASRWWLWTAIGVAVAGGAATAFALTRSPDTTTVHEGTLGTLRR
jgi:hypothetical protein